MVVNSIFFDFFIFFVFFLRFRQLTVFDPIFIQVSDIKDRFLDTHRFLSVYSLQPYLNAVAKRIVNVRFLFTLFLSLKRKESSISIELSYAVDGT